MTALQLRDELRALLDEIEEQEIKKRLLSEEIQESYAVAKANGFDVKALKQIITSRMKRTPVTAEPGSVLAMYLGALEAPVPA